MRTLFLAALLAAAACTTATGPDAARRFDSFEAVETMDFTGFDRVFVPMPVAGEDILERIGARRPLGTAVNRERPLGQRDVDGQLEELHQTLIERLSQVAEVKDEAGPGILTVKTTLTDLNANRPLQIELAQNPGLAFGSIATGDASVRYELMEEGRLLAVIEDNDNVTNLAQDPTISIAIWGTARRFYSQTANRLAALLSDE